MLEVEDRVDDVAHFADAPQWVAETSPRTQWLVDKEVHRLVVATHAEVTRRLTEHRDELDQLAHALLKAETLDAPATYAAAGISRDTNPQVAAAV